jgi:dienelactone hydrolase
VRLVPRLATLVLATCLLTLAGTSTFAQSPSAPPSAELSTDTGQTAVPGQPVVIDYDLGTVTIEQPSQASLNPDFVEMPVHLQGIVAVPEGEGPFPVALLMHGSYPFCTAMAMGDDPAPYPCPAENDLRQYQGFDELASALAADGFLAVVPDMAPEYAEGFGSAPFGERAIQIADATLEALTRGPDAPADVAGKADLDRLVLAGHSRGGSLVVRYATDKEAKYEPRALALLTPAYLAPKSVIPRTMPAALFISQCDGDVGTDQPLKFYQKQLPPLRPAPTLVYTIPGGTHNGFSTKLDPERGQQCTATEVIDPEDQRAIAAILLPQFFDLALSIEGR